MILLCILFSAVVGVVDVVVCGVAIQSGNIVLTLLFFTNTTKLNKKRKTNLFNKKEKEKKIYDKVEETSKTQIQQTTLKVWQT